jgi:YVTN family beta-propeller protein
MTGTAPCALCYNSIDNKVYCANRNSATVTVIDGASDTTIATVSTGSCPQALCYNPEGNKVYCANQRDSSVTVIDGVTNQVVSSVAAGDGPYALCYNSHIDRVYCVNLAGFTVTVIDGTTDSVFAVLGVQTGPCALVLNSVDHRVYVANSGSSSISVLADSVPVSGVVMPTPPLLHTPSLEAYPNPFSRQVSLQLTASGPQPGIRIYDVNGALVRDFAETGSLAPSLSRSLVWDGTDDRGRLLPNGVYLVRVTDGSTSASRQILLLR